MMNVSPEDYLAFLAFQNKVLVQQNSSKEEENNDLKLEIETLKKNIADLQDSSVKASPSKDLAAKEFSINASSKDESLKKSNYCSIASLNSEVKLIKNVTKITFREVSPSKNSILNDILDSDKHERYNLFEAETLRLIGDRAEGLILLPPYQIQFDPKGTTLFKMALCANTGKNNDYRNTYWFKGTKETSFCTIFNKIHPEFTFNLPGWAQSAAFVKT